MSPRLGILAEDKTDCEALETLARRVAAQSGLLSLGVVSWPSGGCGRLQRKAGAKLSDLARDGCTATVLVHDLDLNPENAQLNDEHALRATLTSIAVPPQLAHAIIIPVEEIEAWFWSDDRVVKIVGRGTGKASPSPHLIRRPKEALMRLSKDAGRKPRYNTNDNASLAAKLDLDVCAARCRSFREFREFVASACVRR